MTLTPDQRANLKSVRISEIVVRHSGPTGRRGGRGDMRILKGLATLGLVEIRDTMSGPAYCITDAGRAVLS